MNQSAAGPRSGYCNLGASGPPVAVCPGRAVAVTPHRASRLSRLPEDRGEFRKIHPSHGTRIFEPHRQQRVRKQRPPNVPGWLRRGP